MSRTRLILFTGATALVIAGCSSTPATTPPTTAPPAAAPAASAPAATTAPAAGALSGKWNGQYSGAFSGTFVLNWTQASSKLTGTINLSTPPSTLPINGTVTGNTIRFGTVGSAAISYTGTVSGNSMSGTYTVAAGTGSTGGTWSANKA